MEPAALLVKAACEAALPPGNKTSLFINASAAAGLDCLGPDFTCQTYWRGSFLSLKRSGINITASLPHKEFGRVILHFPKNMDEGRSLLDHALTLTEAGGILVVGAANDAGGKRLPALLKDRGMEFEKISKARCTVCVTAPLPEEVHTQKLIPEPNFQLVLNDSFISCAGIFGWDRIDKGSALLASVLPDDLRGTGADFGCGYGYLARAVLERSPKIKMLHAIDADWRAVEASRQNLSADKTSCHWLDITSEPVPERLDFIVMNPPFHIGKATTADLGLRFIEKAATSLKKNGVLWMVANTHLPYEAPLERAFFKVEQITQENGFKVIKAVR